MKITGVNPVSGLAEIVEIPQHPFLRRDVNFIRNSSQDLLVLIHCS